MNSYRKEDKPSLATLALTLTLMVVAAIPILLILLVPVVLLNGWMLKTMWGWFIVPTFGLKVLSIGQALGVSMVASLFTIGHRVTAFSDTRSDGNKNARVEKLVGLVLSYPIILLMGWVIKTYAM